MRLNKANIFLWVIFGLMLSSCSPYLKYFQTAQQSFNQGAEAENLLKTNPNASVSIMPESNYRMARTFIMKAMGDIKNEKETHDKTNLAKDGLLLNAYTIKALSEWKLGLFPEAIKTSRACKITFENDASVQNQRDYIIMMALEPLVYNDSIAAYTSKLDPKTPKKALTEVDKSSLENLKKGFEIIKEQRATLAPDHPVQTYLIISQLSLAKNWKNLSSKLRQQLRRGREADMPSIRKEMEATKAALNKDLVDCFKDFSTILGGTDHGLYQTWKKAHVDIEGI